MPGAHRDTGEIPTYQRPPDPYMRHAAGRAPVPQERPVPHLRAARTGEQPAVQIFESPDRLWDSVVLWFAAIAAALALAVAGWNAGEILQIRHALDQPVVVTTTAPTPTK